MSLADEARERQKEKKPYHIYGWLLVDLGDEASDLEDLIADPQVTPTVIWQTLIARGYVLSERTVSYWCRAARIGKSP